MYEVELSSDRREDSSLQHYLQMIGKHDLLTKDEEFALARRIRGGDKASDEVWEGARGLEWTVPSPAPYHTFESAPDIKPATITR